MDSIYFKKSMLNGDDYYYLDGECPEIMSVHRVYHYADNLLNSNRNDGALPDKFKYVDKIRTLEEVLELLDWFGEKLYRLELPPKSIDYVEKLNG